MAGLRISRNSCCSIVLPERASPCVVHHCLSRSTHNPMQPRLEIRPIRSEERHLIAHYITGLQRSLIPLDP